MISREKWNILTTLQKLPKNVANLGKIIVIKGFEKLPKYNKLPNLVTRHPKHQQQLTLTKMSLVKVASVSPSYFVTIYYVIWHTLGTYVAYKMLK